MGLVVLVFLAGLAGGVLGARLVLVNQVAPQMREHLGAPPLDRFFLLRDLDLSPEQRESVRELLRLYRGRFEALHRELRPRVESLMDELDRDVETILTPDQLERYRNRPKHWRRAPHSPRTRGPRRPHRQPHEPESRSDSPSG